MKFGIPWKKHSAVDAIMGAASGGGGAGGAPAGGAPSGGQPSSGAGDGGTPAGGQPSQASWADAIQNPELKTWVTAKGFKDGAAAAESAYNLEKLIGHDKAGRTIVLPKDDATPDEQRAFFTKIGVPEKPDDYKLPVPEGDSGEFAKTASTWFHKHGVPAKAAEGLAKEWNEFQTAQIKAAQDQIVAQSKQDTTQVLTEWGQKADANMELIQKATAAYVPGKDGAERRANLVKMESAMGSRAFLEFFLAVGQNMSEVGLKDGGGGPGGGSMTPTQAQAQIDALKKDKDWSATKRKAV